MKSFSPMTPEEKRARRRVRDRAAYARDPEKFRKLSRENRLKPGAPERHESTLSGNASCSETVAERIESGRWHKADRSSNSSPAPA